MMAILGIALFVGAFFILRAAGPFPDGTPSRMMSVPGMGVAIPIGCTCMFAFGALMTVFGVASMMP